MFSRMLKLPDEVRAAADLSSLEVIVHAAAPCPVPVKQQMIEWFGPILLEYYAATEGNGCTFITSEDWLAHPGSVGRAVLSDIRILDDDGNECPTGTSGTVWFAGATDFEYFGDPEKTASSRRDGGKTSTVGDVGYLDEDGYLFLTDRKAHMIISGGVNIYPQETENLLVTHPKVLDAAVIGVPNEDLGEEVKAVVQPVEGVAGDDALERELIAFCRDHLAHFKCPRSVDFVERAAPPAHRKALQGRLTGAVLGRSRDPHRVTGPGAVALPDDLVSWVEEVGGGRLSVADRRQGGARKEAWYVDLERPDGTVGHLFLRYDRSDPARTKDPWTLHREATVYLALQDSPVPVPRVVGVHPVHQAMLSERVAGENWFSRIADPAEQEETARDFMVQLAALHSLDPGSLDLPAFPPVKTVSDAVHAELDEWERVLVERGGTVDPALAFSLRWLRRNVPGYGGPPVLVQGDTGPGNFMYLGGRVTAVVDWELAHLGDPMDDIAWLSLRATQEPFTDFPTRLREYEALSGNADRRGAGALLPGDGRDQAPGDGSPTGCRRNRCRREPLGGHRRRRRRRQRLHLPDAAPAPMARGARCCHRTGIDAGRRAAGPGPARARLDVRRSALPAARRDRAAHLRPAGCCSG